MWDTELPRGYIISPVLPLSSSGAAAPSLTVHLHHSNFLSEEILPYLSACPFPCANTAKCSHSQALRLRPRRYVSDSTPRHVFTESHAHGSACYTIRVLNACLHADAASVQAGTVSYCPADNICYAVGIPSTTASSGSGDVYFQISAPTSYEWVALGTGEKMAGANIFLMYQDGSGNVTVSSRQATGHTEPEYDASTASTLELLSGSGVTGDTMVANVRCADCETWSSGTLDVTSTSAPWIGAWKAGSSLASTSLSEGISIHDEHSQFDFDLTQASVTKDSNPFVGAEATDTSSSSGVSVQTPNNQVIWAHGLGMAIAFAVLYPLGSALMPMLGKWYIHGGFQIVTWLLMWAAFGLGVFGAKQRDLVRSSPPCQMTPSKRAADNIRSYSTTPTPSSEQ